MQHSLIRSKNEKVKIFSQKEASLVSKTLRMFSFSETHGFREITPTNTPIIDELNVGYYSTEITTPSEHCYLLMLFCGNPVVMRVGSPEVQFIYWGKLNSNIPYKHFNEFGELKSEGLLQRLNYGFYFYEPVEETLGYIEVENRPYVLNVPYSNSAAGIGIDVDWKKVIIRRNFSISTTEHKFKLNSVKPIKFIIGKSELKFSVKQKSAKFESFTKKVQFKINCK